MADRTLTINHADGGSETYTINRDKFAGVRNMTVDGANVSVDHTAVPKEQSKETTFGGSQSITVKRDIEPLLSKVVGGAAAAYSLRDLNDKAGNNKVVRVRRASDNHERDFLAKEVSNGTLQNWVNTQVVAPLDIKALADSDGDENIDGRTGPFLLAKAAYSLRSLGTRQATLAATNDTVARANDKFVAQVRRNVNGDLKSFTATEVTDGTLTSFVNESFTSSLPLDVSGSASAAYGLRNLKTGGTSVTSSGDTGGDTTGKFVVQVRRSSDDTIKSFTAAEITDGTLTDFVNVSKDYVGSARFQNTNTSSVSLSSSFTLEATNSWSIKFGYIGGDAATGLFGSSSASLTGFWTASSDIMGITDDSGYYAGLNFGAELAIKLGKHYELEFFNTPSEGVRVIVDGVTMTTAPKIYGNITLNQVGESRTRRGNRVIENVRIDLNGDGNLDYSYAGDGNQASNWTDRVGSNNGTPHSSVLTYNNEFTDGFVKTWYDQSGNTNDAVQTIPERQPKIVNAGTYLGKITLDDTDDFLNTPITPNTTNGFLTILTEINTLYNYNTIFDNDANGNVWEMWSYSTGQVSTRSVDADFRLNASSNITANTKNLITLDYISSRADLYKNGTSVASDTSRSVGSSSPTTLNIGAGNAGNTATDGSFYEFIYYDTDQSDKRRAIEESIATANGITLGSFNRDGFVKTWYDQSVTTEAGDIATGNHATQATPANQPKIAIDANGNVDGIDFDGTNVLETSVVPPNAATLIGVCNMDVVSSTQLIVGARDSTNQRSYLGLQTNVSALGDATGILTGGSISAGADFLLFGAHDVNVRLLSTNGTVVSNPAGAASNNTTHGYSIGAFNNAGTNSSFVNGKVSEVIIYASDQSDNRTAIEANIGEAYSIDLPSGVDSGFDQVDGFVETWYDQSGNSRDATQPTAGSQPKIVDEGSLVTGGIDFDGTDDIGLVTGSFSLTQTYSTFSVSHTDDASTSQGVWSTAASFDSTFNAAQLFRSDDGFSINSGTTLTTAGTINYVADRNYLQTNVVNGGSSSIFVDGATGATGNMGATNPSGVLILGYYKSGSNIQNLDGAIKELIIYNTDQSANRPAIEANINNQYDIY